jgi:hypothetical protein
MRKKQALISSFMSAKTVVMHRIRLYWGPYGPPLMGRGLGWALEVRPIAHCWLGFGPGPRAHLWALRKSTKYRVLDLAILLFRVPVGYPSTHQGAITP